MSDSPEAPAGFLSRWSRRKAGIADAPPARPEPVETAVARTDVDVADVAQGANVADVAAPPAPTLDDVAALERDSDFRRFVAPDVTPEVKNAAMKKLFADPHFNVMDGLDTYIDDYGKPDPIPASMLRQMVQSNVLGLFSDKPDDADAQRLAAGANPDGSLGAPAPQLLPEPLTPIDDDHHAALRLQPLDTAGPPGAAGGAGQDAGRER